MDKAERAAINTIRGDTKSKNKFGAFRGKVESIDDPDRLGRCRVRVWAIHGDEHRTPTFSLPWAEISEHGGGGYDYGPFNPPPVGSAVWTIFEGGDEDFPVIFGTFRGIAKRDDENPNLFLVKDGQPITESAWVPPDDSTETPKDIFDGVHNGDPHPTRRVLYKTYKGFTIMVEEGDGKEYMKIIDRAGQLIMFDCPVVEEISSGNKAQRGVRDAHRGDQISHDAIVNRKASIRIKDLSGQEIILNAQDGDESVTILSRARDGSSRNTIKLSSGKGKDLIEITDTNGDRIVLDPHKAESFRVEDSAGNSLVGNREDGTITVTASKQSQVVAKQGLTTIDGQDTRNIGGNEETNVQGNLVTNVVGDASLGVLGNTLASLSGALKLLITNTSPSGVEAIPLDVTVTTGDVSIKTLLGKWLLESINGDMTVRAELGKILIQALAGDAVLTTALGKAVLQGGPNTYVGDENAIEPNLCGNIWTSFMLLIVNALAIHNHGGSTGPTSPPIIGLAEFTQALQVLITGAVDPSNPLSLTVFTTKQHTP